MKMRKLEKKSIEKGGFEQYHILFSIFLNNFRYLRIKLCYPTFSQEEKPKFENIAIFSQGSQPVMTNPICKNRPYILSKIFFFFGLT